MTDGDMLRLKDRVSNQYVRFVVTGLYRPRQVSSPYWGLNDIPLSGSSTVSGFTTYGPLTVQAAAFAGPLTVSAGSWLAQPQTESIPSGQLSTVAGNVQALSRRCRRAGTPGPRAHHEPALGPGRNGEQPGRRPLAAGRLRCAPVPAGGRGPARRGPDAARPAGGRVGHADGARSHPLAVGQADRGRGDPAVRAVRRGRRLFGVLVARLLARTGGGGAATPGRPWPPWPPGLW